MSVWADLKANLMKSAIGVDITYYPRDGFPIQTRALQGRLLPEDRIDDVKVVGEVQKLEMPRPELAAQRPDIVPIPAVLRDDNFEMSGERFRVSEPPRNERFRLVWVVFAHPVRDLP